MTTGLTLATVGTSGLSTRPVVLPESILERGGELADWNDHFSNVAIINGWGDDEKLLWLRVKLIGRAQAAYKRLSEETRVSYGES